MGLRCPRDAQRTSVEDAVHRLVYDGAQNVQNDLQAGMTGGCGDGQTCENGTHGFCTHFIPSCHVMGAETIER